ncbi:hypothetical protein ACFOKI_16235 [Sphingomonas qilianensis]|uniref:Uncharacterized protein n=1 Tax=Sphingomonas qilianensis TaxID=1736690 RepID=A0ABU9XWJ7_9SPHN
MRDYFSLFDLAIAGVPVVLFCLWQLVSVNREIAKDKKAAKTAESASPQRARHPVGEHRLDDR